MENNKNIRNFAIVAHIDHGKSTLADRLLEATGTIEKRDMREQILDSNPIERERGITIKLAPVRMLYKFPNSNSKEYILNLIDTPGHVDFSYEVSRSLAACEGILLVIDVTAGIQAQTVAHMQQVRERNLPVIPIINKIDLPSANIWGVKKSLIDIFGFEENEILEISAKKGINIERVLYAIIERIPPPSGDIKKPFKSLVFSSQYDSHRGVIVYIRIIDGKIDKDHATEYTFKATGATFLPIDIGIFDPGMKTTGVLGAGEVGYVATGLKDLSLARIGDTLAIYGADIQPLAGYKEPKQMVFLSFFPLDNNDYLLLRESLEKLHLSDSSFSYKPYSSLALGKGYLCGFLGLLHADVVRERLEREFQLATITTSPTVEYELSLTSGQKKIVRTPEDFPDPAEIKEIKEPLMYTTIFSPKEYVGAIMQLCQDKRAEFVNLEYIEVQAKFTYIIPLSEMIIDFFDRLKSVTSGYASLDYEFYESRPVDAVKLTILLNHRNVDAFSRIVVREKVHAEGNSLVEKLKNLIPRHQFQIPIQAAIGGKIIARSDVKSFRKDVTAKLYGGDRTRKDKLLEAQKKGKKRLKQLGNVVIPQEVFLKIY